MAKKSKKLTLKNLKSLRGGRKAVGTEDGGGESGGGECQTRAYATKDPAYKSKSPM